MSIFSLNSITTHLFAIATVLSLVAPIVYGQWSLDSIELYTRSNTKLELVDGVYDLCQLDENERYITYISARVTMSDPYPSADADPTYGYHDLPVVHLINGVPTYPQLPGGLYVFGEIEDYNNPYESFAAEGLHQVYILGNSYTYTVKSCDTQPEPDFKLIHGPSLLSWDFIMATIYVCQYDQYDEATAFDASNSFFQYETPDLGPSDKLRMNHWIDEELVLKTKLTAWGTSDGGTEYRYNGYLSDDIDFSDPSFLSPGTHSIVLRPPKGSDHPVIKYKYRVVICIS